MQLASNSFNDVSIPHIEATTARTLFQRDSKQAGCREGGTRARNDQIRGETGASRRTEMKMKRIKDYVVVRVNDNNVWRRRSQVE